MIYEIGRDLTKWEARGIEQAVIEKYGLASAKGGQLMNKINSISNVRYIYRDAVRFGWAWLEDNLPRITGDMAKEGVEEMPKALR
jgi:hypothetical protein